MPSAEVSLSGEARSASIARRFLAETLAAWDCATLEIPANLLLTELVANAALHAKTDIVVRLVRIVDGLRLEVADRSPRIPVQRHYSLEATTGRGLALVASLARSWGIRPDVGGKVVWCEIPESSGDASVEPGRDFFPDLDTLAEQGDASAGAQDSGSPRALGRGGSVTAVPRRLAA